MIFASHGEESTGREGARQGQLYAWGHSFFSSLSKGICPPSEDTGLQPLAQKWLGSCISARESTPAKKLSKLKARASHCQALIS